MGMQAYIQSTKKVVIGTRQDIDTLKPVWPAVGTIQTPPESTHRQTGRRRPLLNGVALTQMFGGVSKVRVVTWVNRDSV